MFGGETGLGCIQGLYARVNVSQWSSHGRVVGEDGDKRSCGSFGSIVVAEEVGVSGGGVQVSEEAVGMIAEFLSSRGPKGAAVQKRGPILRWGLG